MWEFPAAGDASSVDGLLAGRGIGHTKNHGKSQFLMGKSTISMAIFNSYLYVYQGVNLHFPMVFLWFSIQIFGWCSHMFVGFFDVIREKPNKTPAEKNKNKIVEYFPWWLVHEIRSPFRSIRDGDVFHHFLGYISLTTNQIIYGVFLTNNRMVIWWMDGKRWIIIYYHDITLIFPWYCHDITIITMMVISDPTDGQICRLGGQGPLQINPNPPWLGGSTKWSSDFKRLRAQNHRKNGGNGHGKNGKTMKNNHLNHWNSWILEMETRLKNRCCLKFKNQRSWW